MGFYGSEDSYLPVLLLHPEQSAGTQALEEEKNKYNTSRESLSSYFYVNVLVRKGPHLGSHKKKKKKKKR